jgi:hypothetical protein
MLAIALVVIGGVIWVAGLVAVAQYWEDLCFDDLDTRPGYGSYGSVTTLWPPSFECRLAGSSVEAIVIKHPLVAVARSGVAVVFPVLYTLFAALTLTWAGRSMR